MIDRDDLRAAVAAGIVSEAQAASLTTLSDARRAGRDATRARAEPFELFRGFNEIFIVVGLIILGMGWFGVWNLIFATNGGFRTTWIAAAVATLTAIAALSEYFIVRRRMVAPAIALTIGWAGASLALWVLIFDSVSLFGGLDLSSAVVPFLMATATMLLFWVRYRVPFAIAILAASAFAALMIALANASGQDFALQQVFRLSAQGPFALGTLVFGLVLFGIAMWFDMSDPHRISLRSSNGFWLHVIAAPAIVNTLALSLLDAGTTLALAALAVALLFLAIVSIVIDRRSFLVSGVGYVVVLMGTVIDREGLAPAILILGVMVVGLGAGWHSIRRRLLGLVPETATRRLPPAGESMPK